MLGKVLSLRTDRSIGKALRLPSALLIFATGALYAANATVTSAASPAALPPAIYASAPSGVPAVAAASQESTAMAVPAVFSRGAEGLSPKVLAKALDAVSAARSRGVSGKTDRLTVIDYSLPSSQPRLWVLDLARGKVLFHELVAHGSGSGDKYATRFSNVENSRATSLGLFLTGGTYEGGKGYSLTLKGLDPGVNDQAESRHVVVHGAWYVSEDHARQFGMIGRSWGCPALPQADASAVIDAIKGGSFVYAYAGSAPAVMRASLSSSHPAARHGKARKARKALARAAAQTVAATVRAR